MNGDGRSLSTNINQYTKQHTQNTDMNTTLTHTHTLKHNTTPHPHSHNHNIQYNKLLYTHRTPLNLGNKGNSPTIKAHRLERREVRYSDLTLQRHYPHTHSHQSEITPSYTHNDPSHTTSNHQSTGSGGWVL